jgi:nitrite reductase/ring-hydroxylating ferredoxin subunit
MGAFAKAITAAELGNGMKKTVIVAGKKIAIANVDGEFFAIDDTCTHEQCSLGGEGFLDGNVIICGCHGATFDITTGKVLSLPAPVDVKSYETKVEHGEVLVNVT